MSMLFPQLSCLQYIAAYGTCQHCMCYVSTWQLNDITTRQIRIVHTLNYYQPTVFAQSSGIACTAL